MKRVIVVFICFMFFNISCINAKSLNDMYNELASLKSRLNESNNNKKLTELEISNLKSEIVSISNNISRTRSEIKSASDSIVKSENEIKDKKEECNQLLQVLQLSNNESSFMEYIMKADSYTEMIYRYAIVSQITDYNNGVVTELNNMIDELEKKKVELSKKEANLEKEQSNLSNKVNTLSASLGTLKEEGTSLAEDVKFMESQIKYYEGLCTSKSQDVSTCKRIVSSSSGIVINATGWKAPLASGCVSSEYVGYGNRTDWGNASWGHHGIDLACNGEGTNVYAAAPGEVVRIVRGSSCGGNQVYVYHTVNGKKYTTAYLHLLNISVSLHEIVSENTVVGHVGGGSTATKNGGYDACTTGAHLHFGMANGWNASSFSAYSFNPRSIFNFPSIGGGYFRR